MTKSDRLIAQYGNPMHAVERVEFEKKYMRLFKYPYDIREKIPCLGESVYMHVLFYPVYERFLRLLIVRKLHTEIKTNDQCFAPRFIRGSKTQLSVHSWGMAVDLNPADNALGLTRRQLLSKGLKPFSPEFIQCANEVGLIAGAYFSRPDLMHFELDC